MRTRGSDANARLQRDAKAATPLLRLRCKPMFGGHSRLLCCRGYMTSLHYTIGPFQQRPRNGNIEVLCGAEIDYEIKR